MFIVTYKGYGLEFRSEICSQDVADRAVRLLQSQGYHTAKKELAPDQPQDVSETGSVQNDSAQKSRL